MRTFSPSPVTHHAARYLVGLAAVVAVVLPASVDATETGDTSHTGDTGLTLLAPPPGGLGLIVNEVLAGPSSLSPATTGDANCDGTRDFSEDEFVELVNISGADFDLTGWGLSDDDGVIDHVFGAVVLPPGGAVVVFGGGTPTFDGMSVNPQPHCEAVTDGVVFEVASTGALNLDNAGDVLSLLDPLGMAVYSLEWDADDYTDDGTPDGNNNTSMVRDPDLDSGAAFDDHFAVAPDARSQSPGTFVDGTPFCVDIFWVDADNDGFGDPGLPSVTLCREEFGYADNSNDCDDSNGAVFPGADEVCDGIIGDCDERGGAVPADETDDDGDGWVECSFPAGSWLGPIEPTGGLDCDDEQPNVYPGAVDTCDGQANDCDTGTVTADEVDNDGDGRVECTFGAGEWFGDPLVVAGLDCNDEDPSIYTGAGEICDGLDNDCDGVLPDDEDDFDLDTYVECTFDEGGWDGTDFVLGGGDCNDTDPGVGPGLLELCDGVINGCALAELPDTEVDDDVDGYVECTVDIDGWTGDPAVIGGGDCDDFDPTVSPVGAAIEGAENLCDGIVNVCGGSLTADEIDDDGDGYVECVEDSGGWDGAGFYLGGEDCSDTDATIFPGAPELCDGQVNTCGGALPANEVDNDSDGYIECTVDADGWDVPATTPSAGVDCDDTDGTIYPEGPELCDGQVNACGGSLPANEIDNDGDGYIECTVDVGGWDDPATTPSAGIDCVDTDATVFPGAAELCDGLVNDCSGDPLRAVETDDDLDGYVECSIDGGGWDGLALKVGADCDDSDETVFPSAIERCDGIVNDCDVATDGAGVRPLPDDETDGDGDGYIECTALDLGGWDGDAAAPIGFLDCDDADDTVFPSAPELCDGLDNDCSVPADPLDGLSPEESDLDGDGRVECSRDAGGWDEPTSRPVGYQDCNDADATVFGGAPELCDGQDNNCDTALPGNEIDDDRDGYVECSLDGGGWDVPATQPLGGDDCDPERFSVYPGAFSLCDGLINNCDDDALPAEETDDDQDGYVECSIDPSLELLSIDIDSDGDLDEGFWFEDPDDDDDDGDPLPVIGGNDCDDEDPTVLPGAVDELCDGQNNSCGGGAVPDDEVDDDGDGYVECDFDPVAVLWAGTAPEPTGGNDCDDVGADADTIYPGAAELCDGIVNTCGGVLPADETDLDGDGFVGCPLDAGGWDGTFVPIDGDDCAPEDATVFPGAPPLCDGLINDCDIDFLGPEELDDDGDGYVECVVDGGGWAGVSGGGDCNDDVGRGADFYPGARALCDGLVNNCDIISLPSDEVDNDGDGFVECTVVAAGWLGVAIEGDEDCNDTDPTVYPAAPDLCDGQFNDCVTEALSPSELDDDNDGFVECFIHAGGWDGPVAKGGGDCRDEPLGIDPRSAQFNPDAADLCDGKNNQTCTEDDLPDDEVDDDGDGYVDCDYGIDPALDSWLGDPSVIGPNDCDDDDPTVSPVGAPGGSPELCDGILNVCGGALLVAEVDSDSDGYVACEFDVDGWDGSLAVRGGGDCDPGDASIYPSAREICDGKANDCRLGGLVPLNEQDNDGDRYVECEFDPSGFDAPGVDGGGDCDDISDDAATVYPGAEERCDGIDNDCNAAIPGNELDGDFDGYVECPLDAGGWDGDPLVDGWGDCDDTDPDIYPEAPELCDGLDNDCDDRLALFARDGFTEVDVDGDRFVPCIVDPVGGWSGDSIAGGEDCDDSDPTVYPGAAERCDGLINDCDRGVVLPENEIDDDGDGFVECIIDGGGWDGLGAGTEGEDCNDADRTVYPGALERCDGQRNDCVEEALGIPLDESDLDGDGFVECTVDVGGWDGAGAPDGDDCDDGDDTVFPGAAPLCDGQRNDCADAEPSDDEVDHDGDFFVECAIDAGGWDSDAPVVGGLDCDPRDETVFPGAAELCDGRDNDCGDTPGPDASEFDDDDDGYVECAADSGGWTPDFIAEPVGYDDCDDIDPFVNPGEPEICDGRDNDCGVTPNMDATEYDDDGDGFVECEFSRAWTPDFGPLPRGDQDCDDDDATVHPGAAELCDGQDNDCSVPGDPLAGLPPLEVDDDEDGFVECTVDADGWDSELVREGDDCDDADATVFPGATELCDGQDNDCDRALDPSEADFDEDGFVECDFTADDWRGDPSIEPGDCNPFDPTVNPDAVELCDGQDNDCNGVLTDEERDLDGDGFVACGAVEAPIEDADTWSYEVDWDGDPSILGNDCWPYDESRFPGAADGCVLGFGDGVDNDCDGSGGDTEFVTDDTDDDEDGLTYNQEQDLDTDDCDPDSDGDGLDDGFEWCLGFEPSRDDNDGDGISDGCEFLPELEDVDCVIDHGGDLGLCDIAAIWPIPPVEFADAAHDGDDDGLPDADDEDDDGDGILTYTEVLQAGSVLGDSDGDGVPNVRDIDDDDDGVDTLYENLSGTDHLNIDTDGDLKTDREEWLNWLVGAPDALAPPTIDVSQIVCGLAVGDLEDHCLDLDGRRTGLDYEDPWDRDSDGIINALDPDDDGDGFNLIQENRDEGIQAVECIAETSDGIPPTYDFDTDGDGLLDVDEGREDEDGDGDLNMFDCDSEGCAGDTDGDRIPNCRETYIFNDPNAQDIADYDGDGIPDGDEIDDVDCFDDELPDGSCEVLDTDDDGDGDVIDDDDDGDGIDTVLEILPIGTCVDGVPVVQVVGELAATVCSTTGAVVVPRNTDAERGELFPREPDTIPDYLDPDDDGDGRPTSEEGDADEDLDGVPNWIDEDDFDGGAADTDRDGLSNAEEVQLGTDPLDPDTDRDGVDDATEVGDNVSVPNDLPDEDGIINALDDDDDNDGIATIDEGVTDVDGDGEPNYLDQDSDGDANIDQNEGLGDVDCDGIPNFLDAVDTDGPCLVESGSDGIRILTNEGCSGCNSGAPGGAGLWLLLIGLVARRRREAA
jgi:hypothetical protein